ncbi:MAG TPA: alpha/beta fold hydrolase [Tepidisphaeraceae bacterium]|nr:alpha/beta fold hydrolase [Tepidisphaeraceae bacterium]
MQRPVMNPSFVYDSPSKARAARPSRLAWLWKALRFVGRLLMTSPFGKRQAFRNEEGTHAGRVFRALTYRLAFVPLLLAGFLAAIVAAATHPGRASGGVDPLSFGVYYDPVNFIADDGARLDGWLVPVLDAKRVLEEKDATLGKRFPAVVLVHDFAGSRHQLLPLLQPMHDSGFVVLAINLRGAASLSGEPQTFGIREALDVKAAVDMLRRRAYVDPEKIALVGVGTGANACLIAAAKDKSIAAMVLADPVSNFDDAFADRVGRDHKWLPPLRSLFRWTFQVMYGADTGDLAMDNYRNVIAERNVLLTDGRQRLMEGAQIRGVQQFLTKHLTAEVASVR